jgi:drug/metabolite transporter (DMT)-like permease
VLPAFLATLLFSVSVIFANRATRILGGVTANFLRLCLGAVLLALWAHGFGQGLRGGAFGWFLLSGCVGFGLGDLALYQALPRVGPRLTVLLMQCLAAPFAALTEWCWIGTVLSPAQILAGLVILAGVALAVAPQEHLHVSRRVLLAGIGFGVIAALGQALGAVVSRKAYTVVEAAGQNLDGLTAAYQRILGGVIFAAPLSWWVVRRRGLEAGIAEPGVGWRARLGASWWWIVVNTLAGPTLGVGCYQWALATAPSGVVLPIVATMPIVVVPFAWYFEGDRPGVRSLLGGLVAVAGAVALTLVEGHPHAP